MSDPFDLVKELEPAVPALSKAQIDHHRAVLIAAISDEQAHDNLHERVPRHVEPKIVSQPRNPRRKPRRIVVIPVAVMAALGLAAFAWTLVPQSVTKYANVGCYAADSLNANTAVIGSGNDPISACAELWEQGQFGPPAHPGLAACVLPSGAVGIFPTTSGDSVCSQLNLAVPKQPYPNAVNTAFNSFRSAVVSEFSAARCMSPVNARSTVRNELDTHNLSSWTVSSGTFTSDRPCAGLAFNTDGHQILLVPQPPNQG